MPGQGLLYVCWQALAEQVRISDPHWRAEQRARKSDRGQATRAFFSDVGAGQRTAPGMTQQVIMLGPKRLKHHVERFYKAFRPPQGKVRRPA